MNGVLATTLSIAAVVGALWALVLLVLTRPVGKRVLLIALGVLELGVLAQAVLGFVALAGQHRPVDTPTFVGYLIGSLVILPAAIWWSTTDRSRWGVGVLLLACLVIPVMIVRMNQIWSGSGV